MEKVTVRVGVLVLSAVMLVLPVAAAQASLGRPGALLLRPESKVADGRLALEVAWGKTPSRGAGAQPPPRGSSAQIQGGSSADRYGGSSADRGGVAGAYDRRTRGAHSRGRTNWNRMSTGPSSPSQSSRREREDGEEQQEQGGRRQPGFLQTDPFDVTAGGIR